MSISPGQHPVYIETQDVFLNYNDSRGIKHTELDYSVTQSLLNESVVTYKVTIANSMNCLKQLKSFSKSSKLICDSCEEPGGYK